MTPIETLEAVYRDQVRLIMQTIFTELMAPHDAATALKAMNRFIFGLSEAALVRSAMLKALNAIEGDR